MVAPNVENVKEGFWGRQPKSQYHQKSTQIVLQKYHTVRRTVRQNREDDDWPKAKSQVSPSWHFYIIIYRPYNVN